MNILRLMKHEAYKNSSAFFDQALVSGSTFLTLVVCAHYLPPVEQGKLGYVLGFYLAALMLNQATVFQGASVRAVGEIDQTGYRSTLFLIQSVLATVITGLILLTLGFHGGTFGWMPSLFEATYLSAFLFFQQMADYERRTAYIFRGGAQALAVSIRTYPVRIAALVIVKPTSIDTVLLIASLSAMLGAFSAIYNCKELLTIQYKNMRKVWEHLKFSIWLIINAPLSWLWAHIPVFALGLIRGPESVAILVSLRSLATATNIIVEQVEIQIPVRMARRRHHSGTIAVEEIADVVLKAGTVLWLLGLFGVLLAGKWIITFLFGAHYSEYAPLLPILWIAYWIQFSAKVYALKHRALHNLRVESLGALGAVLASLMLAYPLINEYGVYGAGWLIVVTAILIGIIQYAVSRISPRQTRK